jgi:hypothetical protein
MYRRMIEYDERHLREGFNELMPTRTKPKMDETKTPILICPKKRSYDGIKHLDRVIVITVDMV